MSNYDVQSLVSSKEILEKTIISRATLNNYIKLGIIPRPVVRRPFEGKTSIRNIGYFPSSVMNVIEDVKRLKKEGKQMEEIAQILGSGSSDYYLDKDEEEHKAEEIEEILFKDNINKKYTQELKLTLEDIVTPAYFLNYDFEIIWINHHAQEKILNQKMTQIDSLKLLNIFQMFFNWEFHSRVQNWRDFISFHMTFAKRKFSKTWLSKLYKGIISEEISILEEIYDESRASSAQTIQDTFLNVLMKGGFSTRYHVYTAFFTQGILFLYSPMPNFSNRATSI